MLDSTPPSAAATPAPASARRAYLYRCLQVFSLVAVFAIAVLAVVFADQIQQRFAGLGYLTVFVITLVASATIILPAPAALTIGAFGVSLDPWLVGLVAATGQTIGELSGYYVGWSGKALLGRVRGYARVRRWMDRWGVLALFLLALIPNPFFDIAGMIAGATHFGVMRFMAVTWPGRVIKNTGFAFAGLGFAELLRIFGG